MKHGFGPVGQTCLVVVMVILSPSMSRVASSQDFQRNPYDIQVAQYIEKLKSPSQDVRAAAAESLGFLRAYDAADALTQALEDGSVEVRREAAMALAWCGDQTHIDSLLKLLDDEDWVLRQSACASLTNLTGMAFPYDALADTTTRGKQARAWREWWSMAPHDAIPGEILQLARGEDLDGRLRAVRALGSLGGDSGAEVLLKLVEPFRKTNYQKAKPIERTTMQAALQSLARLHAPKALPVLIGFLETRGWARYAADALGLYGDPAAVQPLAEAYPRFAKKLSRELAEVYPHDDLAKLGWDPQDRMYETPYAIMVALSRLPLHDSDDLKAVRTIVPVIVANIPSDWDGGLLYEQEAHQLVTAYLLERTGFRRIAIEAAFRAAALVNARRKSDWQAHPLSDSEDEIKRHLELLATDVHGDVPYLAQWLPAFCRDEEDVPRLIELLDHESHWIRINATKALMFMHAQDAIEPLGQRLRASKPEGAYLFSGVLEHAEYNDPAPRWREAFVRALGRLGATGYVPLIVDILEDDRNVLDVRHAAALALDELGTPWALAALKQAESEHAFHTVRLVAREALWRRGLLPAREQSSAARRQDKLSADHARSLSENPVVGPRASGFATGKDGEAGDIAVYRRWSRTPTSRKTSRSKPDRILRQAPRQSKEVRLPG